MPPRPRRFLVLSALPLLLGMASLPGLDGRRATAPVEPPACRDVEVAPLSPAAAWRSDIERGGTRCFAVALAAGEFLRAVVEIGAPPPLTGALAQLFAPGDTAPAVQAALGNDSRAALSLLATTSGLHHIVVRDVWSMDRALAAVPVRAWIEAVEPPPLVQARAAALAADERVGWLRGNAHAVRSIAPDDDDFADLEPLRPALEGVRIVLLGEADHYSGSDLLAKSRLVRFLHRQMGYDLLAFEAGMYGMAVAWDSLRAGSPPRQAFALGAWPFWAQVEQMQPLIRYIAAAAGGPRPLEIAGFDSQFVRPGAAQWFAGDLAAFLRERGVASPLADAQSAEYAVLGALAMIRYRTGEEPHPGEDTRAAFMRALEETTARVADLGDERARWWAQLLRGTAAEARFNFARAAGASIHDAARIRNAQMAEHLIWLAAHRHPDRRIMVWAANPHVMRLAEVPPAAGSGPSLGLKVWERFGTESFVIATTSHEGSHFASDQHALAEFEQLMTMAGFRYGLVDLRTAAREQSWTGGAFLARPINSRTREAVWSSVADALFFVRQEERSRRYLP
jgi:erythromycin esterase